MKSSAAIFMASIPRLAPRVPAPISDGTSINLMFFMQAMFWCEDRKAHLNPPGGEDFAAHKASLCKSIIMSNQVCVMMSFLPARQDQDKIN